MELIKYSKPTMAINKGSFIRHCPCSPQRLRCSYYTITPAIGCPFDCSYCFLNFYQKQRQIIIYSNTDEMFKELDLFLKEKKGTPIRMGTGEFMDSLALKELDDINMQFYDVVNKNKELVFEFKTKSDRIDKFMQREPLNNIVLSWSLNPTSIIEKEEHLTASLDKRIKAASIVARHGYSVALHLDPIFMEDNLLDEYLDLIDKALMSIPAQKIRWISMGGFRYTEELKLSMLERTGIVKNPLCSEFVKCNDGKYRYPRFRRAKFYDEIGKRISKYAKIKTYMCMEDPAMWERTCFGDKRVLSLLHTQ